MEWLEKIIRWLLMIWISLKKTWSAKEEMQSRTKEEKFFSFDTLWYFCNIMSYKCTEVKTLLHKYMAWSHIFRSRVFSSVFCNLLINLPCFHTTFPTQFQLSISVVSDQEKCGKLERQLMGVSRVKNDN